MGRFTVKLRERYPNAEIVCLDGTLTKGFLIIKFSEYLVSVKLFSKENYSRIKHLLDLFFESKITKRQVVIEVPELYALSLKDRRGDEINQEARNFVEEVNEVLLYPYAEELVKTMKKLGMTIGLSGAPSEVVKCLKEQGIKRKNMRAQNYKH